MFVNFREGLGIIRKESQYGPPKEATYDTTTWAEAGLQFNKWRMCFMTLDTMKKYMVGDLYFISSVWKRNSVRYLGIHMLDANCDIIPKTGMNLDCYEWNSVMQKSDEINVALYGAQAEKGVKHNAPENELQMWMYEWSVSEKKIAVNPQMEFFSEADAHKDAELNKPLVKSKDKAELVVTSKYKSRPSETMQMRMVLFEVMKVLINDHKYHNCEGCQLSRPANGQKAHMKIGGCLDESLNAATGYIEQVWFIVALADLVAVSNTVCHVLGISPQGSPLLAKAALKWVGPNSIIAAITYHNELHTAKESEMIDPMLSHVNSPLLEIVQHVVHQLDIKDKIIKKYYTN